MVRRDGGQGRDPRHDIGQVAEGVFQLLWGIIGHLRKGSEGGHIDKGAVVEGTDVPLQRRGVPGGQLRGRLIALWDAEGGGAVVGGAGGDIAQQRRLRKSQQPGGRLAQRAVSAAADHPVKLRGQLPGDPGSVPGALGGIDGDQPARFGKGVHDGGHISGDSPLAGGRIVYKKQPFHKKLPRDAMMCGGCRILAGHRSFCPYNFQKKKDPIPDSPILLYVCSQKKQEIPVNILKIL